MNELINNARTNRNQHRSSTLPGLQLQETLWWLGVVGLLVYLWGLLQFITGDWQSCWLAGPHELAQLLHQAPPKLWGKLFSRCLALLLSSQSLRSCVVFSNIFLLANCYIVQIWYWWVIMHTIWWLTQEKQSRGAIFSSICFGIHSGSHMNKHRSRTGASELATNQESRMNKKSRSSICNLLQKWVPKVFNPQKTKSFPPPWPKTACNLAKVTQQKGRKRSKKN